MWSADEYLDEETPCSTPKAVRRRSKSFINLADPSRFLERTKFFSLRRGKSSSVRNLAASLRIPRKVATVDIPATPPPARVTALKEDGASMFPIPAPRKKSLVADPGQGDRLRSDHVFANACHVTQHSGDHNHCIPRSMSPGSEFHSARAASSTANPFDSDDEAKWAPRLGSSRFYCSFCCFDSIVSGVSWVNEVDTGFRLSAFVTFLMTSPFVAQQLSGQFYPWMTN